MTVKYISVVFSSPFFPFVLSVELLLYRLCKWNQKSQYSQDAYTVPMIAVRGAPADHDTEAHVNLDLD